MTTRSLFALSLTLLATGCSHRVYSPPARYAHLETPAPVAPGEVALAGEIHGGGGLFGPDLIGGSARVRYGAAESLEISGDLSVMHVDADTVVDTHPNVYAARAGLKWAPGPIADFFALTAGVGGGASAGGGFVAPEAGLVLGYENRYAVPFVTLDGLVSLPIDPQEVDTGLDDDEPGEFVDTPDTTLGVRAATGVRIPITFGGGRRGSIYLAYTHLMLWDADLEDDGFGGLAGALELSF